MVLFVLSALVSGLLFGLGLFLSGMTNPLNIVRFLDLAGDWNPALAVVMAVAIMVAAPAYAWMRRTEKTLLGEAVLLNNRRPIDKPLVIGSAIFGIGWGLSGLCPAPALLVAINHLKTGGIFVGMMVIGLVLGPFITRHFNAR